MRAHTKLSLPSPALIVAALALAVALAGTAIAAPDLANHAVSKSQVKRIAKRQAIEQIDKKAPFTRVESVSIPDGLRGGAVAVCEPGETMIGGGATPAGTALGELVTMVASGPVDPESPLTVAPADGAPLTAWGGFLRNEAGAVGGPGGTATLNVFAVCSK
jgi:hypothetical protein